MDVPLTTVNTERMVLLMQCVTPEERAEYFTRSNETVSAACTRQIAVGHYQMCEGLLSQLANELEAKYGPAIDAPPVARKPTLVEFPSEPKAATESHEDDGAQ